MLPKLKLTKSIYFIITKGKGRVLSKAETYGRLYSCGFEYVKEFLLVPTFGACIHVPPPPPNQVIYVILDKPVYFEKLMYAVWVSGIVEIGEYSLKGSSDFGPQTYDTETSYLLRGQKVEEID